MVVEAERAAKSEERKQPLIGNTALDRTAAKFTTLECAILCDSRYVARLFIDC